MIAPIDTPAQALRDLEDACSGDFPRPFYSTEGSSFAVGPGDKLYSLEALSLLRQDGLVTSWRRDNSARGNASDMTTWWLGERSFEGPGWCSGVYQG